MKSKEVRTSPQPGQLVWNTGLGVVNPRTGLDPKFNAVFGKCEYSKKERASCISVYTLEENKIPGLKRL